MSDYDEWMRGQTGAFSNGLFGDENGKVYTYSDSNRRLVCYFSEINYITSRTVVELEDCRQKNDKELKESSLILDNVSSTNPTLTWPPNLLELKNSKDKRNIEASPKPLDTKEMNVQKQDISQRKKETVAGNEMIGNNENDGVVFKTKTLSRSDNKSNSNMSMVSRSNCNFKEELPMLSSKKESLTINNKKTSLKSGQKSINDISSPDHNSSGLSSNKLTIASSAVVRKTSLSNLETNNGGQYFKTKSNRTSQYFKPLPVRSINENQNKNRPHLYTMNEEDKQNSSLVGSLEKNNILPKKSFAETHKAQDRINNVKESLRTGVMPSLKTLPTISKKSLKIEDVKSKLLEKKLSLAASKSTGVVSKVSSPNVFDRLTSIGTKSSINKNNAPKTSAGRISPVRVAKSPINAKQRRINVTPQKVIEGKVKRTPVRSNTRISPMKVKNNQNFGPDLSFSTPKLANSTSNKKLSERKNQLWNISPLKHNTIQKRQLYQQQWRKPEKTSSIELNKDQITSSNNQNEVVSRASKQFSKADSTNVEEIHIGPEDLEVKDESRFQSPEKLTSVLHDIDFKDHRRRIGNTPIKGVDESLPEINSDSEPEEGLQNKHQKHLQPWATESSLLSLIRQQQRDKTKDPFKIFGPIDDVEKLDTLLR